MYAGPKALLAVVAIGLLAPSAAIGQDDGVTVESGSPSAQEYAIPLEEARRSASAASAEAPPSSASPAPPSFGQGIVESKPQSSATTGDGRGRTSNREGDARRSPTTAAGGSTETARPDERLVAEAALDTGGPSPAAALVGGGAIVLLGGGAVGLLLRRRTR